MFSYEEDRVQRRVAGNHKMWAADRLLGAALPGHLALKGGGC
jgi:hypothetical protein